jgi:hypothetical protein
MATPKRRKITPISSFDGQNLNCTLYVGASPTSGNIGGDYHLVGTDTVMGITRAMNNTVRQYSQYLVKSCKLTWVPSIGPANVDSGSRIFVSYTTNAELINKVFGWTNSQRIAFCKGARNCVIYNAWERFSHNIPLNPRKKWFEVNTDESSYNVEVHERCSQGMIIIGYESISAAVTLGTWKTESLTVLRGLDSDTNALV